MEADMGQRVGIAECSAVTTNRNNFKGGAAWQSGD